MTKQEKTALNMVKFIRDQIHLLLDKLNELDMDTPTDMCERLQEDAENLLRVMQDQLRERQSYKSALLPDCAYMTRQNYASDLVLGGSSKDLLEILEFCA